MSKLIDVITDKKARESALITRGFYNGMNDADYIKKVFKLKMGYDLNLDNPVTFNEKLQWLKLNDRNEIYSTIVDKAEAKKYVAKIIGEEYIIPTLKIWERIEDVDFNILPNQFVIKCTHNSGLGIFVCKNKDHIKKKEVLKNLKKGLNQNYYYTGREWPYKNVKPRIIAEQYIEDNDGELKDYKFFCFNGVAECVMVCSERASGNPKFYFFDRKWKLQRLNKRGKEAPEDFTLEKPNDLDKMFDIAETLARGMKFVRVDLYNTGKIYFGELTLYPDSGFDSNLLPETDRYFGDLLKLY